MSGESTLFNMGRECGDVVEAVTVAFADKKISFGEGVGIAQELLGVSMITITHFDSIKNSFVNGLSDSESEELRMGFAETFTSSDSTKVDECFKAVMKVIGSTVEFIAAMRK